MTDRSRLASLVLCLCVAATVAGWRATDAGAQDRTAPNGVTEGVVVDSQDRAVVRARVRLVDANGEEVTSTLTDGAGRFAFATTCGTCTIEASLPGFVSAIAVRPDTGEVRLVLNPAPVQESVIVSATRDEVPTSQVGSSVTVFEADDIERRGAPLVADLLRSTPGVSVVGSGGLGSVTSLFVRGGESSYNKVLLDGIPLNEPGGTFNFSNLTTGNLERIEVVRGAQSALFGSDAMSSVVQLVTRRGDTFAGRPRVTFGWEGGTHSTRRAAGGVAGRTGGLDYAFEASRLETDNHVPNNAFDNTTASWNAGGQLTPRTSLRLVGRFERQEIGTPGATAFGRPDSDASFEQRQVVTGLTVEHRRPVIRQQLTYAYTRTTQTSTNLTADPPYTPTFEGRQAPFAFFDFVFDSHNVLERHRVSYQADWRLGRLGPMPADQFLTALVDFDGERADLEDRMAGTVLPASRNNVGVSLQHQAVGGRLALTTGLRVEHNESFGTAVAPRISAAHTVRRGSGALGRTTMTFNAGLGVKEPTLLQSFSPSPFFLGNPDLEPERSRTIDVGLEQRLAGDRARVEIVWFDNRYRNQISTRTTNVRTFESQYFNVGRTTARGLEFALDVVPVAGWRAGGGYTFLASRIDESTSEFSPVFAVGQWAFRRPRHSGFVDVGWTGGRAAVSVFGVFVGRRVDSDFSSLDPPLTEAEAYTTWTVTGRYELAAGVEWFLRIENLTDAEYMEPLGFPAWSRTAHSGIRVRF